MAAPFTVHCLWICSRDNFLTVMEPTTDHHISNGWGASWTKDFGNILRQQTSLARTSGTLWALGAFGDSSSFPFLHLSVFTILAIIHRVLNLHRILCACSVTTSQHHSKALGLRYGPFMSIRSNKSLMVELWWRDLIMPWKEALQKTRRQGGNAMVIFRWDGFREFRSGYRT